MARILAFSGSLRTDSYNGKLVRAAADGARQAGAEVTVIHLRDYPLPVFDEDLERESGLPTNAVEIKKLLREHQGFLIASPEYNGSLTAALKNVIDWASRRIDGEESLACFQKKCAALMSTSPGGLGGLRGLTHLRTILSGIGVLVLPQQLAVPGAHNMFDEGGAMTDASRREAVEGLGAQLATLVSQTNST